MTMRRMTVAAALVAFAVSSARAQEETRELRQLAAAQSTFESTGGNGIMIKATTR